MAEDVRLEDEEDKLLDELAALNEADPQFNTKRQQYENAQRRKAEAAVSRYGRETVEKLKDELGERMRFTFWLMDSLLEPDGRVPEHVVRETALRYPDFDEHIQRLLGEGKEDVLHEYVTAFAIWSVTSARGEHEAEVGRAAFYYLFRDQGHQLFEEWCTHAERVHYGQEGRLIPPFEDWLAEFEAWKKRRKVALPPSPNPFLNAVVPFASCKPAMGTVEAIFNAKAGWPLDENGLPRYVVRMEGKRAKGDFSYHILLPTDSPDEEAINTLAQKELALQILRDLGPDTAWLHMLLLAYAVETRRGERFVTPREVIYRILGLDKRSDLDRGEKDARCFDEIDHLRRLGINIMRLELNGKELTYGRRMGPIWELAWEEYGQGYLEPKQAGRWTSLWDEWHLIGRPGVVWADVFLYGQMRQFGWMAREMLENIDRRKAPWGAALAVLLTFQGRFSPSERVKITPRELIEFAGGDPNPDSRQKRHELKLQVLNAYAEQERWGCRIDYTAWPPSLNSLRPDLAADRADDMLEGDGTEATPERAPRNYWPDFLQAETWITPPAQVVEANKKAHRLPAQAPQLLPARKRERPYTGADLKADREKLGWTQADVAQHLGLSLSAVRKMERGTRRILPRYRQRLRAALRGTE